MSDWRHQPDAPESVKYHRGFDPAEPPEVECPICGEIDECDCPYDQVIGSSDTTTHDKPNPNNETGCAYCEAHKGDSMMPPHKASDRCESGKRNHCTCDICY